MYGSTRLPPTQCALGYYPYFSPESKVVMGFFQLLECAFRFVVRARRALLIDACRRSAGTRARRTRRSLLRRVSKFRSPIVRCRARSCSFAECALCRLAKNPDERPDAASLMVRLVTLPSLTLPEPPVDCEAHFGIGTASRRRLVDSATPG